MRALLVAVALAAAACGGASDEPADPSTLVLRPGDLPGEWDHVPHDDEADNLRQVGDEFGDCVGIDNPMAADAPQAAAPDFAQGSGARQVKNVVQLAGSAEDARTVVSTLGAPSSPDCITEAFRSTLPQRAVEGIEVEDLGTAPLAFESDAEATEAVRTTLALDVRGTPITVHVDLVFVAVGPWFARFQFLGTGEPLDPALQHRLVATVVGRLEGAR